MYQKVVIGIDESYTRTGISAAADGQLRLIKSTAFKGCHNATEKRNHLKSILSRLLTNIQEKRPGEVIIICEKIRQFSHGSSEKQFFSMNYIKKTGALIAAIVDTAYEFNVPVYSVDTRSWKAKVIGTSKGGKNKKLATIKYICSLGFTDQIKYTDKKGNIKYNDDAADSAGIALYGFIDEKLQKLKRED